MNMKYRMCWSRKAVNRKRFPYMKKLRSRADWMYAYYSYCKKGRHYKQALRRRLSQYKEIMNIGYHHDKQIEYNWLLYNLYADYPKRYFKRAHLYYIPPQYLQEAIRKLFLSLPPKFKTYYPKRNIHWWRKERRRQYERLK